MEKRDLKIVKGFKELVSKKVKEYFEMYSDD